MASRHGCCGKCGEFGTSDFAEDFNWIRDADNAALCLLDGLAFSSQTGVVHTCSSPNPRCGLTTCE